MSAAHVANRSRAADLQPRRPEVRAAANASKNVVVARYPLAIVMAAVCVGIFADREAWPLVPRSMELWWCVCVAALGSWYALWRNNNLRSAIAALAVALAAAGGAWHHACWNLFSADDLGRFALGSQPPVCLEAIAGVNTDGLLSTPIYEAHGAAVLNTAQYGAISATINPAGLEVNSFRPMPIASRPRGN